MKKSKVSTAIKKYVHKIVDAEPEKKQWPTAYDILNTDASRTFPNFTPIDNATGNRTCLNIQSAIVGKQGVADNQRIGSKIKVHSMFVKGTLQIASNQGQAVPIKVRHIVIVDHRADGVAMPLNEVLATVTTNNGVNAPFNEKFRHSHTLLCDKTYVLNSAIYVSGLAGNLFYQGACTKDYSFKHTFKRPLTLTFYTNNSTENISSVEGPAIYSYLVAESGGANALDQQASIIYTDA